MYRPDTFFPPEPVNFLFNDGGLGDNLARIPVLKYVKDKYTHVHGIAWVPDYFLELGKHLLPNVEFQPFSKGEKHFNSKFVGRGTSNTVHNSFATHLVDTAFHVLIDRDPEIVHKNYIPLRPNEIDIYKFKLPEKYIVITTGFTAEVREMLPNCVNEIADFGKKAGYDIVFLGNKCAKVGALVDDVKGAFKQDIDYSKGINLIDKTTLLEAGAIISKAKTIVGLDNGLLHLAGCTDIPIVMGFTTVEPRHRMPYRNNILGYNVFPVVPPEELPCRFCQSSWEFIQNDFRKCWYVSKGLDKEIQCVKLLTADRYIEVLKTIL